MIVITGVGRSGTSVIAAMYERLGVPVGGEWVPTINAGLEDREVVEANELIMSELGLTGTKKSMLPSSAKRAIKRYVSARTIERVRSVVSPRHRRRPETHVQLLDWSRLPALREEVGPRLRALSHARQVVKDPRFRYTLPVWLGSGAHIEHVLISLRDLEAAMKSKIAAGYESEASRVQLRNWLVYGLGLCIDTVLEHRVDHDIVRYPDFLTTPDDLYDAMRFPSPVDRDRFRTVFREVVRPEMVHHR